MGSDAKIKKVTVPFLIQAEVAAATAFDEWIVGRFLKTKDQMRVRAYLSNPVFRPLFELFLNGATSLSGAKILKAEGLIETESHVVRFGELAGYPMEAVRILRQGTLEIDRFVPSSENDPVFEIVEAAIASYVAIDYGAGIVARRQLIDFAIDYQDSEILMHLVSLNSGLRQHDSLPFDTTVSEKERLEEAEYWSGVGDERGGAAFINLAKRS